MDTHGTATLGQFAELAAIVTRALPKALEGRDVKETLMWAGRNGEELSVRLHTALTPDIQPQPKPETQAAEPASTPELPTEFTAGGQTYTVLSFLEDGETSVKGDIMLERGQRLEASMGEEDGEHLLEHQSDIPAELRGKVVFVFPEWRDPDYPEDVTGLDWYGDRWIRCWSWRDGDWHDYDRLVRRT